MAGATRTMVLLVALCGPSCMGGQVGVADGAGEVATTAAVSPQEANTGAAVGEGEQEGAASDGNAQTPPDANAPTTPAAPAAPFNCDEATYPVCDGFETVAVGQPPNPLRWNSQVSLPSPDDPAVHNDHPTQNTILVSDKFAHTGSKSLHLHSSPGWAHLPIEAVVSAAYPKAFLPAAKDTFFVRLWVYNAGLAGDMSVQVGSGHWYMVNASGPLSGRQQYQKFGGGGDNLGWNYYGDDSGLGSNVAFSAGKWTCYEVQFKGDTNELMVWQDDQAIDSLHSTRWAAPNYNRLTIGWEMDHPDGNYPGHDVYIDDVAFAYTRIGCAVPKG